MRCPHCSREMVALFFSAVCESCEAPTVSRPYRGWVVYRGSAGAVYEEYVFRTRQDAERWREAANRHDCEVREVFSDEPFRWRRSRGSLRDLELADQLFEIFPDHRFRPAPRRAFVA